MKNIIFYTFIFLPLCSIAQAVNSRGVVRPNDASQNRGTTYAVVIGISKYKEVTSLNFADRDAAIFADFLLSKNGMALDSNNVKLFVNEKATLNNIGNTLSDIIIKDLKKGDRVIFFFAGHGDYDANILKDQALLLLYGAPAKNYFQNIFSGDFISTADLNARFIEPVSKKGCEVMLFIDACHATGMNRNLSGGQEGGRITSLALQNMTSSVKIYSCQANQYSLESEQWGGGRGLFSYILMEGLYGMADADGNKTVTLRELQRYLEDNVPKMAAPNKQDPIIKVDDATEPIAKVNEEFLASYKNKKDKNLVFIAKATTKGSTDFWLQDIDSSQKKLYLLCDSLIEKKELQKAYETFLIFAKKDSSSDVSVQLKRNLSAALQEKTAAILRPILEDVTKWNASSNDVMQAERDLEKAADLLGPHNFLYKNLQARILFLKAIVFDFYKLNKDSAISFLEQSISLEPNAPYSYFQLAGCYGYKKDFEKSKSNLEKYLSLIPNSAISYYNLGTVYEHLKNHDEAIKNLKKAIELKPDYAVAFYNLGFVYAGMNNNTEAINSYKKSIELDPHYAKSFLNLGLAYDNINNQDEAIANYKKALALDAGNPLVYLNMGIAYEKISNHDEAIKNLSKAIEINPSNAIAYTAIAVVYNRLKNYDEAVKDYKKAIEINPVYELPTYSIGLVYENMNNHEEAIKWFKKSLTINPNNAYVYFVLGNAYAAMKNAEEAIKNFTSAINLYPDYGVAYYNLGCVYSIQNNTAAALNNIELAIKKNFKELNTIANDTDLNNICTLPEFKIMINKYFTKEELDKYPKMFITRSN
jgi:tetratricopeptide (TPR) repeat protein